LWFAISRIDQFHFSIPPVLPNVRGVTVTSRLTLKPRQLDEV